MPYIEQDRRKDFDGLIEALQPKNPGELNYAITKMVQHFLPRCYRYSDIAMVTGVLENVKQEFYRRAAVPYEDHKIKENGDVY